MKSYISKVKLFCEENKYRFTEPRKQVLEVILSQKIPLSAYDILKVLSVKKDVKPPTIYRAIDFLSTHGFIHRVESLNSYIVCDLNYDHEGTHILICDECGMTKEIYLDDFQVTAKIRSSESFKVRNWNTEIYGLCQKCA